MKWEARKNQLLKKSHNPKKTKISALKNLTAKVIRKRNNPSRKQLNLKSKRKNLLLNNHRPKSHQRKSQQQSKKVKVKLKTTNKIRKKIICQGMHLVIFSQKYPTPDD